jgi:hypothetical protein
VLSSLPAARFSAIGTVHLSIHHRGDSDDMDFKMEDHRHSMVCEDSVTVCCAGKSTLSETGHSINIERLRHKENFESS